MGTSQGWQVLRSLAQRRYAAGMRLGYLRVVLLVQIMSSAALATEARPPRVYLALDLTAPWPKSLDTITPTTDTVALAALSPPIHDISFAWGALSPEERHALFMRIGYRFAQGNFPDGSVVGSNTVEQYQVRGFPWLVGLQSTFFDTPVKPVANLEAGFVIGQATYQRQDGVNVRSGYQWCRSARVGGGVHLDVSDWLGLRLLLGVEWTQALHPERGPSLAMTNVGLTLAAVGKLNSTRSRADDGTGLRDYGSGDSQSRNGDGYAEIRAGDEAKRRRDLPAAEAHYRKGVRMLPRDQETRLSVEVPVRIDWADLLVEIGRAQEAVEVLREAQRIAPQDRRVAVLLEELRRRGYQVEPVAPAGGPPADYY